ncbi:hypothetical protein K9M48_04330 [Candidatus Gracilibacteria bacterium]|nr:hypothetical protein [Candidatus Gracilibacteria bacterium]
MKKSEPQSHDPHSTGRALYEFVNLMLDIIEEERGKIGLIQYFAEIKLCNALNGIVYGPDCKPINLCKKNGHKK